MVTAPLRRDSDRGKSAPSTANRRPRSTENVVALSLRRPQPAGRVWRQRGERHHRRLHRACRRDWRKNRGCFSRLRLGHARMSGVPPESRRRTASEILAAYGGQPRLWWRR